MMHNTILAIVIAASAPASSDLSGKDTKTEDRSVEVQQILPYDLESRADSSKPDQIGELRKKSGKNADVSQLPGDIEVLDAEAKGPEQAIVRTVDSPEARLYSQVAEVWEVLRNRGQQPTPELIAREIGPDALATFLDQNPGAEGIFGQDSDSLPLDVPGELELPDGTGTIILPPTNGG